MSQGRGFWCFDNLLVNDTDYIEGCNLLIKATMERYSIELQNLENPKDEQQTQVAFDIISLLLHNIFLLEVRSYTLKYKAYKKIESERTVNGLNNQIEKLQDYDKEDYIPKLELLKKCLQDVHDQDDNEAAMKVISVRSIIIARVGFRLYLLL